MNVERTVIAPCPRVDGMPWMPHLEQCDRLTKLREMISSYWMLNPSTDKKRSANKSKHFLSNN